MATIVFQQASIATGGRYCGTGAPKRVTCPRFEKISTLTRLQFGAYSPGGYSLGLGGYSLGPPCLELELHSLGATLSVWAATVGPPDLERCLHTGDSAQEFMMSFLRAVPGGFISSLTRHQSSRQLPYPKEAQ